MSVLLFTIIMIGIFNQALAAKGSKKINWYLADVPAVHMADGPRKGRGFLDLMLYKQLVPALPQYVHSVQQVPVARREGMLKTDPYACAPGLFKTPGRGGSILYSSAYSLSLPPGFFTLKKKDKIIKSYSDKNGVIGLKKLLEDAKLTVGIVSGRSYGSEVDKLLSEFEGKSTIYRASSEHAIEGLTKMLKTGRIDLVLANIYEPIFQEGPKNKAPTQATSQNPDEIYTFWPVQEQSPYELVYAACSSSEAGKAAIQDINSILAKSEVRKAASRYFESWLRKEDVLMARRALENAIADGKIAK